MELSLVFAALFLGLLSGFHCVAMCGPLALSMGFSPRAKRSFLLHNILYQIGRAVTYGILGSLSGLVSTGFSLVGLQRYLSIFAGVVLLALALYPLLFSGGTFSRFFFVSFVIKVQAKFSFFFRKPDAFSRFLTGVINGLLPCGMVYMALASSLACGSVFGSMLYMFLFGIGTIPMMFCLVLFGDFIRSRWREKIAKAIPYVLSLLGLLLVVRGLSLGIPYLSIEESSLGIHAKNHCH